MTIAAGEYTIIDFNDIEIAFEEPLNPSLNQVWLDVSTVPNILKRWDGERWVKASPTTAAEIGAETPEGAQQKVDAIEVGGRNLIPNSNIPEVHTLDTQTATFTRSTPAYLPDGTQVPANVPRFPEGKFGQAVLVEEGTTNLLPTNISNVETDLTGFHTRNGAVISRDTTQHWEGNASLKVVTSSQAGSGFCTDSISASPETAYTASIWLKGNVGGEVVRFVAFENANNVMNIPCTLTTEWQRFTGVATTLSTSTSLRLYVWNQAASEITFYADGLQIEKKSYPTSFTPGTRSPETLTIPTAGVLNPQEGAVECWVYIDGDIASQSPQHQNWIFAHATSDASPYPNALGFRRTKEGVNRWDVWTGDGSGNITILIVNWEPIRGWHYFAMRWSPSELAFFIDGVKRRSVLKPYLPTSLAPNAYIGSWVTASPSSKLHVNTLIDDIRISNRARTDEEIAAAYASGQPLPVDQYTTYKMGFDDTLQPTGKHERLVNLEAGQKYTFSSQTSGNVQCSIYEPTLTHPGLSIPAADMPVQFIPDWTGEYKVAFSANESCSLKVKLEKGNKATDWTPAPEDAPTSLYELDPDAQGILDSHDESISIIETDFVQLEDSIGTKVSQTDFDEFGNLINQQISAVEQTQDSINMEFSQISENITNIDGDVTEIKTGIRYDEDGMHIGKSDSPLQMTLSNEQLGFLDNGLLVAYVNGQKLYITMAEILESLVVGNHKIEKYDENITLVRWVG